MPDDHFLFHLYRLLLKLITSTNHFYLNYARVRLCSKLWDIFSTTRMRSVFFTAYIAVCNAPEVYLALCSVLGCFVAVIFRFVNIEFQ